MSKLINADDITGFIKDGSTVAIGGFVGSGAPEEITSAIEKSFVGSGRPKGLTIVYAAGQGDRKNRGINHLAYEGLVKRVIGGHWGLAPKMVKLAIECRIEAYNFPQGVITHLFRDIAARKPGTITHVGLRTFVDPRISGAKMNKKTTEDLIEVINLAGREWLFYRAFPIDVALIRGTSADAEGNISMEKEAGSFEMLAVAQAAHNSGGIVIAQVERLVKDNTLNPWIVKVPGVIVNYIVMGSEQNHWQTFTEKYNPAFSGEIKAPIETIPPMKLDERKIISRRALKEIDDGAVVNLGIGLPEGVSIVATEEGVFDRMKLTVEAGIIGGIPAGGLNFGTSFNPECIVNQPSQFDFYDGGGLDVAFLGMAQVDSSGNVNVSRFLDKLIGCGGFINISQNTKKVVFCGTMNSVGLKTEVSGGRINILEEGKEKKFVQSVEQVTFSGNYAIESMQDVLYITERGVFKLTHGGMLLTEISPGIDLEKQVLKQMEFAPLISPHLKQMDEDIFK